MTETQTDGLSVSSYLRVLARWKWLIIVVTLLVTVAGTAYIWTRTPMYTASSELLYMKQIDIANRPRSRRSRRLSRASRCGRQPRRR
jgi:uncharacterized protein involved in exopolysaccharide biosynthesis